MSGILKIIDFNAVSEDNLEAISDFFCGSGHVITVNRIEYILLTTRDQYKFMCHYFNHVSLRLIGNK